MNNILMFHHEIMSGKDKEMIEIDQAIYNFIGTGKFSLDIKISLEIPPIIYNEENISYIKSKIITIMKNYICNREIIVDKLFKTIHIGNAPFETVIFLPMVENNLQKNFICSDTYIVYHNNKPIATIRYHSKEKCKSDDVDSINRHKFKLGCSCEINFIIDKIKK